MNTGVRLEIVRVHSCSTMTMNRLLAILVHATVRWTCEGFPVRGDKSTGRYYMVNILLLLDSALWGEAHCTVRYYAHVRGSGLHLPQQGQNDEWECCVTPPGITTQEGDTAVSKRRLLSRSQRGPRQWRVPSRMWDSCVAAIFMEHSASEWKLKGLLYSAQSIPLDPWWNMTHPGTKVQSHDLNLDNPLLTSMHWNSR